MEFTEDIFVFFGISGVLGGSIFVQILGYMSKMLNRKRIFFTDCGVKYAGFFV